MEPRLCVIPGDGIGQEVVPVAVQVLRTVLPEVRYERAEAGWECFRSRGVAVPPETLDAVRRCGAALFGATASPGRVVPGYRSAILTLRQQLGLYANIRPAASTAGFSPRTGVDLVVVRENTEDLYVGRETRSGDVAVAERVISATASRRIARVALRIADTRGAKKLTIVHKANVLPVTDGLFRDSVREVVAGWDGPSAGIEVEETYVDVAALRMVGAPESFDVVVTTNLFGDILSDAAAHWSGGLGVAPSLNLGDGVAIAEPVHGSAPDIAGTGAANPAAAILSVAMLLEHVWERPDLARRVTHAVGSALAGGVHPPVLSSVRDTVLHLLESSDGGTS
ncbi:MULTISPECIES: isocitrate/isopropylmalate dehydrogenase family protein [Catenuloplanes]|uniref:Homoisocitrate dehydrogenase n=1 Tax=Catenuloplanes niger TaxID=587534 RepID=A0AAE3ZVZ0_9ACTN|nr:isocitrate/isopropylmalate dehydrogenase family protein [Catenuloplanes niger]MDR7326806.1 homoisocitrate dehydrogenase [Catenuloplanes niger]